jgi:hypothetical protein
MLVVLDEAAGLFPATASGTRTHAAVLVDFQALVHSCQRSRRASSAAAGSPFWIGSLA